MSTNLKILLLTIIVFSVFIYIACQKNIQNESYDGLGVLIPSKNVVTPTDTNEIPPPDTNVAEIINGNELLAQDIVYAGMTDDSIERIVFRPADLFRFSFNANKDSVILQNYCVDNLKNVQIGIVASGLNDTILIAKFDSLLFLKRITIPIHFNTEEKYTTTSGKLITIPKDFKNENITNVSISSNDIIFQKLKTIKVKWIMKLNNFGKKADNWQDIKYSHIRWLIRYHTNTAAIFSHPLFLDYMKSAYISKNNGKTQMTESEIETVYNNLLNKQNMAVGVVMNVSGLGGGTYGSTTGTIGVAPYIVNRQHLYAYGTEAIFHEWGHVDGFSHSSTMTYPLSKDSTINGITYTSKRVVFNTPKAGHTQNRSTRGFSAISEWFVDSLIRAKALPYQPTATAVYGQNNSQD